MLVKMRQIIADNYRSFLEEEGPRLKEYEARWIESEFIAINLGLLTMEEIRQIESVVFAQVVADKRKAAHAG